MNHRVELHDGELIGEAELCKERFGTKVQGLAECFETGIENFSRFNFLEIYFEADLKFVIIYSNASFLVFISFHLISIVGSKKLRSDE